MTRTPLQLVVNKPVFNVYLQYTSCVRQWRRTACSSGNDAAEPRGAVLISSEYGEVVGGVRLETVQRQ